MFAKEFRVVDTAPLRWANPMIHCATSSVGIFEKAIDETLFIRAAICMSGIARPAGMIVEWRGARVWWRKGILKHPDIRDEPFAGRVP
jgi:hypothetical protein